MADQIKKMLTPALIGIVFVAVLGIIATVVIFSMAKENMRPDQVYHSTEQNIGALIPTPDMEMFNPHGRMLQEKSDPVEKFNPLRRVLKEKPDPVENLDASMGYRGLNGGYIPAGANLRLPKRFDDVVPYNIDSIERIWNQNVQKFRKGFRNEANVKKDEGFNVAYEELEDFDPDAIVAGEDEEEMSFYLMPPEHNDRTIVGCPKIFPILNGAYQKIYVLSGNTPEGYLVYEYYGKSKDEARYKFKRAFPGCEMPDSIRRTTIKGEMPSTT